MNKTKIFPKIAAFPAAGLGVMAVIAGSKVLLGLSIPDQIVHTWLVAYNVLVGVVSLVAAVGMFLGKSWGSLLAKVITAAHLLVLVIVLTMLLTTGNVEPKSVIIMTVRAGVWAGILLLLWLARPKESN